MFSHRALPKDVPERKKKIAIKRNYSPVSNVSEAENSLGKEQRKPISGRSIHNIKSKRKPTPSPSKQQHLSPVHFSRGESTTVREEDQSMKIMDMLSSLKRDNRRLNQTSSKNCLSNTLFTQEQGTTVERIINNTCDVTRISHKPIDYTNISNAFPNFWRTYEGETREGIKHGFGALYMANGEKFVGFFIEDFAEGHGTYYCLDGRRVIGIWHNNVLCRQLL